MTEKAEKKGFITGEVEKRLTVARRSAAPPFPDKLSIEINNSCNHRCYFCQNPVMSRRRVVMDEAMVARVLREGYDAGIRTVSFYSGGEPFLNRRLPEYVSSAKSMGFDYVYLSSNGGRATSARIVPTLDAGLDSLKFSINAGDRETYAKVHGLDEFDDVMANVARVAEYRAKHGRPRKLFVSFVQTKDNAHTFEALKARVANLVDEVVAYPFVVIGTPLRSREDMEAAGRLPIGYEDTDRSEDWNKLRLRLPCYQLWSYLNVTAEGYLSACCSDYNNDLVVGNLHRMSLAEAWHSPEFQELRRQHMTGKIANTLCHGCIRQRSEPYVPINAHLKTADRDAKVDAEFAALPAARP